MIKSQMSLVLEIIMLIKTPLLKVIRDLLWVPNINIMLKKIPNQVQVVIHCNATKILVQRLEHQKEPLKIKIIMFQDPEHIIIFKTLQQSVHIFLLEVDKEIKTINLKIILDLDSILEKVKTFKIKV